MTRLAVSVVLAACAWMVSPASADTGGKILAPSICGSGTRFTILFWPHGHRPFGDDTFAVVVPQPHFEVYAGGGNKAKYSPKDFVGSAFAPESGRGSAGSFPACKAFARKPGSAPHGTTSTTDSTALVCTFRSAPVHEADGLIDYDANPAVFGVGYSLVQRPNLRVVYVRLWLNRSRLSYDPSFCHPTLPPH